MIHKMGSDSARKSYAEWELEQQRNGAQHRWPRIVQVGRDAVKVNFLAE
jgi:hypothetical protein